MADAIDNLLTQARSARFGSPDEAKRDLIAAVGMARAGPDRMQLAQALTALGQIERDLGHTEEALRHYEEAAAIYRTADAPLKLAHTVRHIGDIHGHEGQLKLAEPCYSEALTIYRAQVDTSPLDMANALRGLALLKEAVGATQEAIAIWEEAGKLYASVNVEAGVAESKRRIELLNSGSV